MGMKFYVDQLMEEKALSLKEEVAIKEELSEPANRFDKLLRQTTRVLADQTHSLAIATDEEGDIYASGMANILDMPEFFDIDSTRSVLSLIDKVDTLAQIFSHLPVEEQVKILFGDELEMPYLESCGFVFTKYQMTGHNGMLGIIGPCRLDYQRIIPTMKYFAQLLAEISKG